MEITLLAFLLALHSLDEPLGEDEESALSDIAAQLYLNPDAWESLIRSNLFKIIESNHRLKHAYQNVEGQIKMVDSIPETLLPTKVELEKAFPERKSIRSRGGVPILDSKDYKSQEITNTVIRVFSAEQPSEITKRLEGLERIKQFLLQKLK